MIKFDYEYNIHEQRWETVLAYQMGEVQKAVFSYCKPDESPENLLSAFKSIIKALDAVLVSEASRVADTQDKRTSEA